MGMAAPIYYTADQVRVVGNGQGSRQPLGKHCRVAATARESHARVRHRSFAGRQRRRLPGRREGAAGL